MAVGIGSLGERIGSYTLIERAAAMRPILERNADKTDSLRRLADENVQALKDTGLCRLMVPARFGGYQTSIRTYIEVMAEVGRGCGSTAWVASLINVCAWLAALFPERAQAGHLGRRIPTPGSPDRWRRTARLFPSMAGGESGAGGRGRQAACTRSGRPAAFT